ncbi:hypothetical protein KCTC52924_03696 [Arenibacter antarcticus]|uniref:Uncharacterized protein n=1 Tax=Arenibacter antarcticus TaxID=2040469 RepID=A0ABW5VDM5_9FLAO|nr:hypothetical protein [Arenibacter sp. H213]MCM4168141.1 hypothetical protein [Arenibacter sp. H213]
MGIYGFPRVPIACIAIKGYRVLLAYGFRHKPFGIRPRILNSECTNFGTAPEIVLGDDGGSSDIDYTWPIQLGDGRVMVVYYFNLENGTRHIAGTILAVQHK